MNYRSLVAGLFLTACLTTSWLRAELASGTLLTYQGSLSSEKADGTSSPHEFTLQLLVAGSQDGGQQVLWTLKDRGGWSWLDRFGKLEWNGKQGASGEDTPSLLFQRGDVQDPVLVTPPFLIAPVQLARGAEWSEGKLRFQVTGERKSDIDDQRRESWVVVAENNFGRKRVFALDKQQAVLNSLEETVFLGQGEKHYLRYERVGIASLPQDQLATVTEQFERLVELRERIDYKPRSKAGRLSEEQLATVQKDLPELARLAAAGPLQQVVQSAVDETKSGRGQQSALSALESKALGQAIKTQLEDLRGKKVDLGPGQVTVLHFWEYQDAPLEEPYGQAAYLDFLNRRYKGKPVQIYGVVAPPLTDDAPTRSKAVSSARKFHSFMNLSYPLLVDDGKLLKKIGDPRFAEAKLPLFVVLDDQGEIVHYHVGFYEVDRDRGIAKLDRIIEQTLQTDE